MAGNICIYAGTWCHDENCGWQKFKECVVFDKGVPFSTIGNPDLSISAGMVMVIQANSVTV